MLVRISGRGGPFRRMDPAALRVSSHAFMLRRLADWSGVVSQAKYAARADPIMMSTGSGAPFQCLVSDSIIAPDVPTLPNRALVRLFRRYLELSEWGETMQPCPRHRPWR